MLKKFTVATLATALLTAFAAVSVATAQVTYTVTSAKDTIWAHCAKHVGATSQVNACKDASVANLLQKTGKKPTQLQKGDVIELIIDGTLAKPATPSGRGIVATLPLPLPEAPAKAVGRDDPTPAEARAETPAQELSPQAAQAPTVDPALTAELAALRKANETLQGENARLRMAAAAKPAQAGQQGGLTQDRLQVMQLQGEIKQLEAQANAARADTSTANMELGNLRRVHTAVLTELRPFLENYQRAMNSPETAQVLGTELMIQVGRLKESAIWYGYYMEAHNSASRCLDNLLAEQRFTTRLQEELGRQKTQAALATKAKERQNQVRGATRSLQADRDAQLGDRAVWAAVDSGLIVIPPGQEHKLPPRPAKR